MFPRHSFIQFISMCIRAAAICTRGLNILDVLQIQYRFQLVALLVSTYRRVASSIPGERHAWDDLSIHCDLCFRAQVLGNLEVCASEAQLSTIASKSSTCNSTAVATVAALPQFLLSQQGMQLGTVLHKLESRSLRRSWLIRLGTQPRWEMEVRTKRPHVALR